MLRTNTMRFSADTWPQLGHERLVFWGGTAINNPLPATTPCTPTGGATRTAKHPEWRGSIQTWSGAGSLEAAGYEVPPEGYWAVRAQRARSLCYTLRCEKEESRQRDGQRQSRSKKCGRIPRSCSSTGPQRSKQNARGDPPSSASRS